MGSAHLITLSYLYSEIQPLNRNGEVDRFIQGCFQAAAPGALILFVDLQGQQATFDPLCERAGLQLVDRGTGKWGSDGENVAALNMYRDRFLALDDESWPKYATELVYEVWRKPAAA